MPVGNLPEEARKLFEEVYQRSLKDTCDGDEGCAARIAWTAVKNAGWKKNKEGEWVKQKARLIQFSLAITRAAHDKNGRMIWRASASNTDPDYYSDSMTLELFESFIRRANNREQPPKEFCSEFWSGGLPYVSISHYPDLSGKAAPGITEKLYIDGNYLKAKGEFFDTKLGRACFDAILRDKQENSENPIRISIAFIDYKHRHKSDGTIFVRESLDDSCRKCIEESLLSLFGIEERKGVEYLDGHLIHLALTRVPANENTSVEVEKEMATKKEDAISIIGEEVFEEIFGEEEIQAEVSKSLVVKSEVEDADPSDESVDMNEEKPEEEQVEDEKLLEKLDLISQKLDLIASSISLLDEKVNKEIERNAHPLDTPYNEIKRVFDLEFSDREEKLRAIQDAFNNFGETIRSMISEEEIKPSEGKEIEDAIERAIRPLISQIELITAKLNQQQVVQQSQQPVVPQRRSLSPIDLRTSQPVQKKSRLREIVERTT